MINIQVKGQIEKNGEMVDSTYKVYSDECFFQNKEYVEPTHSGYITYLRENFYLNLSIISSFRFYELDRDINISVTDCDSFIKNDVSLEKGTKYISFFRFVGNEELVFISLAFPHEGEFQRFQRILTDKLCAK